MLTDNAWSGSPCYLVGGGPSLRRFDWGLLKAAHDSGAKVIALNRAYLQCPWADVLLSEDERFYRRYCPRADMRDGFTGEKILVLLDPTYRPVIEGLDPKIRFIAGRQKRYGWSKTLADGLSSSSNSAISALNLADILGANPIYLLGIDCRPGPSGESNYHDADPEHDAYPKDWRVKRGDLESFKSDFTYWAALHLRNSGKRTVNLVDSSRLSALDCWDRWDRESFLRTGMPATIWAANQDGAVSFQSTVRP